MNQNSITGVDPEPMLVFNFAGCSATAAALGENEVTNGEGSHNKVDNTFLI